MLDEISKPFGGSGKYLFSWYGILLIVLFVYKTLEWIGLKLTARRLGCKPIVKYQTDAFFGFGTVYEMYKLQQGGYVIDYVHNKLDEIEGPSDTSVMRLAGKLIYATIDPENVKAMLSTQFNEFSLGPRHAHLSPLLGDSIFTLEGEGWKHSRAMLRPQFVREQIGHVKMLEPHIQLFAKHVRKHKGKPFDLQDLIFRLTVDSATEFLFGECVDTLKDESIGFKKPSISLDGKEGFYTSLDRVQTYMWLRSVLQDLYFLANTSELKRCVAGVHAFANYYVQKALDTDPEELKNSSEKGYIILYELVKETRDPKVLKFQLLSVLLAGRDPTAALMSFAMYELARHPKVWNKLKEEINENFGLGEDANVEKITFESLKRCEYLRAIIHETLRLYPPVPQNLRTATKTTTLPRGGGELGEDPVLIPKGQTIAYPVYSLHRNTKYYGEDAKLFRPERWFEPRCKKLGWAFIPFNGGPRVCLGQQFALTEASYVITRIMQMFPNIEDHNEVYPPRKTTHLIMFLKDGCNVSLY